MHRRTLPTRILLLASLALTSTACPSKDQPVINSFTAGPMTVEEGGTTTLSWSVTEADDIRIDAEPGGQVISTSNGTGMQESGAITENTMFTLSATNDEGTVRRTISVLVQKAGTPTVDSFTATPGMVESGGNVILAWETTNADSVDITPNVLTGGDADGMTTVNPDETTTYTITARNAEGMAVAQVVVTVIGPQILSFVANPQDVALGDDTVLSWNVTGAESVLITDDDDAEVFAGATLMGQVTVTPAVATPPGTVVYTLVATDSEDRTARRTVTVDVNRPDGPQIDFYANPSTIPLGQTSTLEWAVTNAASIEITDGTTSTTTTDLSGSLEVMPLETTTYRLIATDANDVTAMAMAIVTVMPGPPAILDFSANPNPIALGDGTTLSWSTVSADSLRILNGATELYTTTDGSGTFDVTPTVTSTTYTLEATNALGTNTFNVTVYAHTAPVIDDFDVSPLSFTGSSTVATISWDVSNVASLELFADGFAVPGFPVVDVSPMIIDDVGTFTATVTNTTSFTLVAQSAAGSETVEITVANLFVKMEPNDTATAAIALTGDGGGVLGSITPAGDNDWFVVMVPAGGNLSAQTSDGQGGCALDTHLRVYDSTVAAASIADNDDIDYPANACSLVTPFAHPDVTRDPDLADMPAGLYYVRVTTSSFVPNDTGPYVLTVSAGGPACGNTLVEGVEQCDDGNILSGDGCSTACGIEAIGVVSGPQAPSAPPVTFTGSIVPSTRLDFYRIEMAAPGYITANTFTGAPGQCSANTVLALLDSAFTELGSDDDDGPGNCSTINPEFDTWAFVPAGTYWLRVEERNNDSEIASYGISIRTFGQGCGNGILEMQAPLNEICDDGNAVAGDGCSPTCGFEGLAEAEPNDAFDAAGVVTVTADTVFTGSLPAGDTDYFAVTVPDGYHVDAFVTVGSFTSCPESPEARVRFYDTDGTSVLATDDDDGPNGNCGRVHPGNDADLIGLAAGTYFLQVVEDSSPPVELSSYYLHLRIIAPGCGNAVIDAPLGELCDDGNLTDGDGCSMTCSIEPVGVATLPAAAPILFTSDIGVIGEHDFFQLTVTATTYVRAESFSPSQALGCASGDTLVALNDSTFGELGRNDDGGLGLCSLITPADAFALLAPGTYYLEIWEYADNATIPYELVVSSVPYLVCGNGVLEAGEQCEDGNTSANDGCSATCTFEINPTVITPPGGTVTVPLAAPGSFQLVQIDLTQAGQSIAASAADAGGTTCDIVDTGLVLADGAFAFLGDKVEGGPSGTAGDCAAIIFPDDAFATNLAAGTHYLAVYDDGSTSGSVQVDVTIYDPICGDTVLNAGEECDDGNTVSGDRCSDICEFEGTLVVETEPNDTYTQANASGLTGVGTVTVQGTTNVPPVTGDEDYFSFTVPANATLTLFANTYTTLGNPTGCNNALTDTTITLRDENDVYIDEDEDSGTGYCSFLDGLTVSGGAAGATYYIVVSGWLSDTQTAYSMDITLQ